MALNLAVISGRVLEFALSLCVTSMAQYSVRCIGMSPRAGMHYLQRIWPGLYGSQHS